MSLELAAEAAIDAQTVPDDPDDRLVADDMLRLIFTCCHPALGIEAQVALTLCAVCWPRTPGDRRGFSRRRRDHGAAAGAGETKIRIARIPYETPDAAMLDQRVDSVLAAIFLVFTEGYAPSSGSDLMRHDPTREAIRLGRLLDQLMPQRAGRVQLVDSLAARETLNGYHLLPAVRADLLAKLHPTMRRGPRIVGSSRWHGSRRSGAGWRRG